MALCSYFQVGTGTVPVLENLKSLCLGPYIYHFIGEILFALSATALKNIKSRLIKWRFSSQTHKRFEFLA